MVLRTVLTRSGLISLNAARPVNTFQPRTAVNNARPMKNDINNAYSIARRPFKKITAANKGNPQQYLKDKGVIDSGCFRHMTGNRSYLTDYEEIDGGFVAFGGNSKGGKITGKGKIRTGKLDFEDVYFVKELKFNLFSVLQMCDKKNSVLFTDTACIVLSPDFKLTDESHVLLKVPRKDNMYSVDLKNVVRQGGLICLFAKTTPDESNLWHRRLGHVNFKTMNKLVTTYRHHPVYDQDVKKSDNGINLGKVVSGLNIRLLLAEAGWSDYPFPNREKGCPLSKSNSIGVRAGGGGVYSRFDMASDVSSTNDIKVRFEI
ncbi:ribonuclease H-like domain-containing protein [Tanacetum coccineum]